MASPRSNSKPKTYPNGTHFNEWYVSPDNGSPRIRRYYVTLDGVKHSERYPLNRYKHLLNDTELLDQFVIRLNGDDPFKRRARELADIKHAYVSEEFLKQYYDNVLAVKVDNPTDARTNYRYLLEFGLHFFMVKLGVHSPRDWKKHEGLWGRSLLNKDDSGLADEHRLFKPGERKASRTLSYIVFEMNRFLRYLHSQRPDEIPLLKLDPLDRKTKTTHDAGRELAGEIDKSKYVSEEHWGLIKQALVTDNVALAPLVLLCRAYGLRRNEGLAVTRDCLKNDHLDVVKQLKTYDREQNDEPVFKPLKGRKVRKVPHWFADPEDTYGWIEKIEQMSTHPDQISVEFAALTHDVCGERYNIDDLRPTFLTDAMSEAVTKDPRGGPEKVRLAAGHAKLETTYNHYIKDTRRLSEQVYVPKKKQVS